MLQVENYTTRSHIVLSAAIVAITYATCNTTNNTATALTSARDTYETTTNQNVNAHFSLAVFKDSEAFESGAEPVEMIYSDQHHSQDFYFSAEDITPANLIDRCYQHAIDTVPALSAAQKVV